MEIVPPPVKSPSPPDPGPETPSGVMRAVQRTAWHTNIQWGVVGAFILGAGSFVAWSLNKLDVVNVAMAQAQVQSKTNADEIVVMKQRVESVDSGTRLSIENLRKEISDGRTETNQQLARILAEVKKR